MARNGIQGLDAHQRALPAVRALSDIDSGEALNHVLGGFGFSGFRGLLSEQFSALCEFLTAVPIGEQSVMADAGELRGQHVQEKPSQELIGIELHDFLSVAIGIVAPAKAHGFAVKRDQAVIGDGNFASVSSKIGDHVPDALERGFGIDHPIVIEKLGLQGLEFCFATRQVQLAISVRLFKAVEEFTSEHLGQGAHGEQEAVFGAEPALTVLGERAAGDDGVSVNVL